jgi:outer membrane lipoprotein LolB
VSGCASVPETVPLESSTNAWQLRRLALIEVKNWRLKGRLSFSFEEQAWHANLVWVQRGDTYDLELSGPLGQGRVRIQGGPEGVRVTSSDGRILSGSTPEAVIWSEFGWVLPVRGLIYWVRGVPDPDQPTTSVTLDSLGRLQALTQVGWKVTYPEYREQDGLDLPRKIRIDGEGINVRVVADQWEFAAANASNASRPGPLIRGPMSLRGV